MKLSRRTKDFGLVAALLVYVFAIGPWLISQASWLTVLVGFALGGYIAYLVYERAREIFGTKEQQ